MAADTGARSQPHIAPNPDVCLDVSSDAGAEPSRL